MTHVRVFPRRTRATPTDSLVRIGYPGLFDGDADRISISVAFTWDLREAEKLADAWRHHGPTEIGGPATGMRGEGFEPGLFVANGYTITSRGCFNRCWYCNVWRREGDVRELPIVDGYDVLDDNLLACSRPHVEAVFAMLQRQKRRPRFTGGLEAKRLESWHVEALTDLRPEVAFFAYDTPDDLAPLRAAGALLAEYGWGIKRVKGKMGRRAWCYVLCGWPADPKRGRSADTFENANERMLQTARAGFWPYATAYYDADGNRGAGWPAFQHSWRVSQVIATTLAKEGLL